MQYFKLKNSLFLSLILIFACQSTENPSIETTDTEIVVEEIDIEQVEKIGATIAAQSFAALSGHLQYQIKNNGFAEAVAFCNIHANPIVDSLSKHYQVDIKRTSLQLRNEDNRANNLELEILNSYQAEFENGTALKSMVYNKNDETYFFAPIYVMDACAKCHGKANETLNDIAYQKLADLYPNDEAIGYDVGDLRGIWSIKF